MRAIPILGALVLAGLVGAQAALADMPFVPRFEAPDGWEQNSFIAGTNILTESGFRPIEDIRDGDIVLSFDTDTQQVVPARVRDVTSRVEQSTYEMGIGGIKIRVTRDHPMFTTQGWRRVIETAIGSTLIGYDGAEYRIATCRVVRGEVTVYNFEVDQTGTYFVSDLKLVAH